MFFRKRLLSKTNTKSTIYVYLIENESVELNRRYNAIYGKKWDAHLYSRICGAF